MKHDPIFPHKVTNEFWTGIVDRIDKTGVGWGEMDDNKGTFDIPLYDGFLIGTRVEFYVDTIVFINENQCFVGRIDETEQGWGIVDYQIYLKKH